MANKIGEYMEEHGINMIRECVPTALEEAGENKIKVKRFKLFQLSCIHCGLRNK